MILKRISQLFVSIAIGIAFILIGALVPATSILNILLKAIGIIMIVTNVLNLLSIRGKMIYGFANSIIGIILGALMIAFPSKIMNIIIAFYLIVVPLLNMLCFRIFWDEKDIIKLIFGIIFFLFSPFFFGLFDAVISVFLIVIGSIIIIGTIIGLIVMLRTNLFGENETKKSLNVSKDDVDFDFSDKN
ncbi:MAG: hypothetical protein J1F32_05720 [Erysipelotrichales bacterium]|nr:hypothetical protein [Erysipelotrichales bacterium]